jgi:hypothetical protein
VIAHRANSKIVPIVTDGNYGLFKRASVIVGKEIDISGCVSVDRRTPTRDELNALNETIHKKMLELRELLEVKKSESKRKRKR